MGKRAFGRGAALLVAGVLTASQGVAQNQVQVIVDRGLTDDLPYTAIYPQGFQSIDDGSSETILTISHPDALLRCDYFSVPGAPDGWTAEGALSSLDVAGIESGWAPNFPGFRLSAHGVVRIASGPALFYEGASDASPMGPGVNVMHAEVVDVGRTYAVECIVDRAIAADARPMIDFIIANFSTRSDGECCINPADDRG